MKNLDIFAACSFNVSRMVKERAKQRLNQGLSAALTIFQPLSLDRFVLNQSQHNAEKHDKIQHITRLWISAYTIAHQFPSPCSQARCWRCHLESERKPDIKPGVQVKRLFWNSFRVDSERNTVWNEIDREGSGSVRKQDCYGKCKGRKLDSDRY